MGVSSLNDCYSIADEIEGIHDDARAAINFAAGIAQMYQRQLVRLAWACRERNAHKREATLNLMLMELEANGESTALLPSRKRE